MRWLQATSRARHYDVAGHRLNSRLAGMRSSLSRRTLRSFIVWRPAGHAAGADDGFSAAQLDQQPANDRSDRELKFSRIAVVRCSRVLVEVGTSIYWRPGWMAPSSWANWRSHDHAVASYIVRPSTAIPAQLCIGKQLVAIWTLAGSLSA